MTQETKAMPGAGKQVKSKSATARDDDIVQAEEEIADLEIPPSNAVYDKIQMVMEKFAGNRLGQMMLEQCDRVLKTVEDTARWSLPQDENDAKLERPLPWVLFLSLIIWLRVLYFWLNISSSILGTPRVTPQSTVYAIQIKRRRLRALRVRGLKSHRRRDQDAATTSSSSNKPPSLMTNVRQLLGRAVCRPGHVRDVPSRRIFPHSEESNTALSEQSSDRGGTKRPRDDESVDLNLTVDQMLNKYANDDSEDDSDYVPNADEDDDGSTSTSSMSSEEDIEKDETEKLPESSKSTSDNPEALDQSVTEVKENGGPKHHRPMPKPLTSIKLEPISDADSGNEHVKTPREPERETTEVAPRHLQREQAMNTPTQQQQQHQIHHSKLTAAIDEESRKRSTPGHESAASLKTTLGGATTATTGAQNLPHPPSDPKDIPTTSSKCCRTITTETSVEYDWSVVVTTEISHRRQPIELPKLASSVQTLTPASSSEDIFYSPVGSPPDSHSIFHPAPLINVHSPEDHSTPKEDYEENVSPPTVGAPNWYPAPQRKSNLSNIHKQHNHQQHYNNKHRNKNRR